MTGVEYTGPKNDGTILDISSVTVDTVHGNTSQDVIMTTEDRLRLRLMEHSDTLRTKQSWMTPLGIFLSVSISLTTAQFQTFLLDGAVWKALFIIGGIVSFIWFVVMSIRAFLSPSIDDLVEKIKKRNAK